MGVVVNRCINYSLGDVFTQLGLPMTDLNHMETLVYAGGPVSPEAGLVVHNDIETVWDSSLFIGDSLALTTSRDILVAMASGLGPDHAILCLGYAGWGPGQLESEIQCNTWFSTPVDCGLVFSQDVDSKWQNAAKLLGFDLHHLSSEVGHA